MLQHVFLYCLLITCFVWITYAFFLPITNHKVLEIIGHFLQWKIWKPALFVAEFDTGFFVNVLPVGRTPRNLCTVLLWSALTFSLLYQVCACVTPVTRDVLRATLAKGCRPRLTLFAAPGFPDCDRCAFSRMLAVGRPYRAGFYAYLSVLRTCTAWMLPVAIMMTGCKIPHLLPTFPRAPPPCTNPWTGILWADDRLLNNLYLIEAFKE